MLSKINTGLLLLMWTSVETKLSNIVNWNISDLHPYFNIMKVISLVNVDIFCVVIFNLHFVIFCLVILYHYLLYSHHTITCKVHGWRMIARCLPDRLSRCWRSRLCWLSVRQSCLGCVVLHFVGSTIRGRTSFRFSNRLGLFPITIRYKGLQNTTFCHSAKSLSA